VKQFYENVQKPLEEAIRGGFAQTLGSAISDAFTTAFSGGGALGAMQAFGKAILGWPRRHLRADGSVWLRFGIPHDIAR
jgi:hypothetical protein